MQYFNTLPKIIKRDAKGNSLLMTNLMARSSVIPSILNNASVFYQYDIQDGDTPESIAYKYYGESYRYWIVLFANEIIDPQWQWPMNNDVFAKYLENKYPSINTYSTIHHYEKILTQFDISTNTTTTETVVIDEDTYNSLVIGTHNYNLPTGIVTVNITKNAINIYNYELGLNEANRTISLLNSNFVGEIESQFQSLMSY
jgi:hypothetical protein